MSTSAVEQALVIASQAADAVGFSKLAGVQSARSWSAIAEATLPIGRPGPWILVDAGLASAESLVVAQISYAKSVIDATAAAFGVSVAVTAAAVAEPAPTGSGDGAPETPKPRPKAAGTAAAVPSKARSSATGASRRRPAAG